MTNPHLRPSRAFDARAAAPAAPNAALLIDFDNVTLGIRSDLTKELKHLLNSDIIRGKVAVQRAYADWRRYPQYIVPLSESSIDLIFAPAFGTAKKNATDIRLAIDAVELVFTRPEIGTFIIMSGDSDFSAMVIKLKEYGKYVIGVGIRESASDLLIQNCDEYFSYTDLAGLTKESDTPSIQRDPWELVGEAVEKMARSGDVMRSDRLKQVMQQIDSNFDERNAGFSRFSKFVTEAGNRGLLTVTRLENGQYEVAPIAGASRTSAAKPSARPAAKAAAEPVAREGARDGAREERPSRRRGRRGGRGREREEAGTEARTDTRPASKPAARTDGALTLAAAFRLMTDALADLGVPTGNEQLRSRMVAMLGREDALLEAARFARLLRQANDAEVADVRKIGDGDEYEVALSRSSAAQVAHRGRSAAPAEAASAVAAPDSAPAGNGVATPAAEPAAAARLSGMRFRRGSRAPSRPASMPLVGVVSFESDTATPAEPVAEARAATAIDASPSESEAPAKPAAKSTRKKAASKPRARKSTAKADKADKADKAVKADGTAAKPAAKRPRRPRKKAAE